MGRGHYWYANRDNGDPLPEAYTVNFKELI